MKPKQALVKDGFLPKGSENGRGRLSVKGAERCQYLVDHEGYTIDGFAKSSASGKPAVESAKPEIVRVKTDPNRLVDVPDALRSDKDWTLVRKSDGKPIHAVGMRNICEGCGSSFTYCPCRVPTFLDNTGPVPVEFRMKKGG
jgi:hypothetical protein